MLGMTASGQEDSVRRYNQYFSIQANQLLRQLLNFGGASQNVNNPFLINYCFNHSESGIGLYSGLGVDYQKTHTGDALSPRDSEIKSTSFRVGLDKKWFVSRRWEAGVGIDIIKTDFKDNTTNKNIFDGGQQSITVETISSENGWGFGPRFNILFYLTEKMILGTESTYYFRSTKISSEVTTTSRLRQFDQFGNETFVVSKDTQEDDSRNKLLNLNLPTVIYLTIRF